LRINQFDNALKNDSVIVAIKIFLGDKVGNTIPRGVIEQQATKDRLLCLNGMRRTRIASSCGSVAAFMARIIPAKSNYK
jgi:hypothetical protein